MDQRRDDLVIFSDCAVCETDESAEERQDGGRGNEAEVHCELSSGVRFVEVKRRWVGIPLCPFSFQYVYPRYCELEKKAMNPLTKLCALRSACLIKSSPSAAHPSYLRQLNGPALV